MDSLYQRHNLLFLVAVRSYTLAKKVAILTPKLQGSVHTKRLEAAWKVRWCEIEEKYSTDDVMKDIQIEILENAWKVKFPEDMKKYLKTVSSSIWGERFGIVNFSKIPCEIPPNMSIFTGYECPYKSQGLDCKECSKPDSFGSYIYWRDGFTDEEWRDMPECKPDITRGMANIGPTYYDYQDYIVLNASDPVNYGTVWERNISGNSKLIYLADSFGDYLMMILRGHLVRKVKTDNFNYGILDWTNNINPMAREILRLDWDPDRAAPLIQDWLNNNPAAGAA